MTDKTGVFKNLGLGITQGNELWAKDFNAAGGVCGRQVKLETVDHGYKADTAKTLYPQIEPKVLGFVQLLGSPVVAALKQNIASDKTVAAPASWSSELLDNPYVMIVGTTYDLEIIDGLSYMQELGNLKDGDTIGHVYIDGEYGKNGRSSARTGTAAAPNTGGKPVRVTCVHPLFSRLTTPKCARNPGLRIREDGNCRWHAIHCSKESRKEARHGCSDRVEPS